MQHLEHFQLSEDPFRSDPLERFDVSIASQRDALARLDRAVRQGKGLVLLVGEVGSGKTRVARRLYEELEEEVFEAGMMVVLRREVGTEWLLSRLARQLGIDEPSAEREALLAQIYERLAIIHEDGRRAVVVIDDAHGLANPDTLSEICGLLKLEYEDRRLLTVILVGAAPLDAAVCGDALFSHHVDMRVEMRALDREESTAYLTARLQVAGGDPEILLPGACSALQELSGGAPGRLNVLADNSLYEAWVAQRRQLTRSDVERAHADLGWDRSTSAPISQSPGSPASGALEPSDAALRPAAQGSAAASPQTSDASVIDLDAPLAASPLAAGGAMDFDTVPPQAGRPSRPAPVLAEATQIQLSEPDPEPEELDAPPKTEDVDDLFMELLDD